MASKKDVIVTLVFLWIFPILFITIHRYQTFGEKNCDLNREVSCDCPFLLTVSDRFISVDGFALLKFVCFDSDYRSLHIIIFHKKISQNFEN